MSIIRCNYPHGGTRCTELLEAPAATLQDPDLWPKHLYCNDVAKESTRVWADQRAKQWYGVDIPMEVQTWIDTWPLPIMRTGSPFQTPDKLAPTVARLLPFEGWPDLWTFGEPPRAALILNADFDNRVSHLTAFGTVGRTIPTVGMLFLGSGGVSEDGIEMQRRLAKWWLGGNAAGRPKGRRKTYDDALHCYFEYRREMGKHPNQIQLATMLDCSERQVRNIVGPWDQFKQKAQDIESATSEFLKATTGK